MIKQFVEISKSDVTGRTGIKLVLHEIFESSDKYNRNGISWKEKYVETNKDSAKGMPLVVQFFDEENEIPYGHGELHVNENGEVTFEDSVVVGMVEEVYIDTLKINDDEKKVLVADGILYNQRYPKFIEWVKETIEKEQIKSSVEIGAKQPNKTIVYEDGYKEKGRVPMEYDYTAHAILYMVEEADPSAILIELNQSIKKETEVIEEVGKKVRKINDQTFEMNALNYYDLCSLITRAFNKTMNPKSSDWSYDYWIHKFYPTESYVIMEKYGSPGEYWKTSYSLTNGSITLSDITEVEESWTPKEGSEEVKIDLSSLREDFNNKESELNSKEGGKVNMEENEKQIQELNAKVDELTSKIEGLNSAVVEANKALEVKTEEVESITTELNSLREFKAEKDMEAKKVEVNTYFENEIKKNGFSEVELNSLKTEYVEKIDLEGLKKAEMELCVKKIKELNTVQKSTEANSTDKNLFMAIHTTESAEEDFSDIL